jgi:predicted component of type VI protein secretion system
LTPAHGEGIVGRFFLMPSRERKRPVLQPGTGKAVGQMDVKLFVTRGSKKSKVFELRSEETIIGRQRGCDLRIPSSRVSRRHCRLSFRDDCVMVEDLASANGSFLNGVAIDDQEIARPGDLLEIGPVTFRIEYRLPTSAVQQMQPPEAHEASYLPDVIELVEEEPRPRKPKKAPESDPYLVDDDEVESEQAAPMVNFDDLAWKPPIGKDLRDLLSELEDE